MNMSSEHAEELAKVFKEIENNENKIFNWVKILLVWNTLLTVYLIYAGCQ